MIVLDSSAALSALLHDGPARVAVGISQLQAPHLIDAEVLHALRRRVLFHSMTAPDARRALEIWNDLNVTRHAAAPLFDRAWQLRDNLSAYDALYVALAERLGCTLVTADVRLSRAAGLKCPVSVVPR